MKNKTRKYTTIVVRGCVMRVLTKKAAKIQAEEQKQARKDWDKNRVD